LYPATETLGHISILWVPCGAHITENTSILVLIDSRRLCGFLRNHVVYKIRVNLVIWFIAVYGNIQCM
jgi:hypothetical protein